MYLLLPGEFRQLPLSVSQQPVVSAARYLAETMRAHSAAALRRSSVPRPARYDTPSREQLDATRAIPETLVRPPTPHSHGS